MVLYLHLNLTGPELLNKTQPLYTPQTRQESVQKQPCSKFSQTGPFLLVVPALDMSIPKALSQTNSLELDEQG